MMHPLAGLALLLGALVLGTAGRFPADDATSGAVAVGAAVVAAAAALLKTVRPTSRLAGPVVFLAAAGQLLLPVTRPLVEPWTGALVLAAALHVFFDDRRTRAPLVAQAELHAPLRVLFALLPGAVVIAAIVLAPQAYELWVPERVLAAYEMQTPILPLIGLAFVASAALLAGALRQLAVVRPVQHEAHGPIIPAETEPPGEAA